MRLKVHVSAIAIVLGGCSVGGGSSRVTVPGFADLDLNAAGLKLVVQAPPGATAKNDEGDVIVEKAPTFRLLVRQFKLKGSPTKAMKNFLSGSYKQVSYPLDEPEALIYEIRDSAPAQFGVKAVLNIGADVYTCGSSGSKGVTFTRADVDTMLASCRSLAAK